MGSPRQGFLQLGLSSISFQVIPPRLSLIWFEANGATAEACTEVLADYHLETRGTIHELRWRIAEFHCLV